MMFGFLNKIRHVLSKRDKRILVYLVIFSIVISIIETLGVSVIMPYISIASDFTVIETNKIYNFFFTYLGFDNEISFVIILGILIIVFYIFRAFANGIFIYSIIKFTNSRYHLIANRLFHNYMSLHYKDFIQRNSSILTKSIINEALYLTDLFRAFLILISEVFIFLFIYSILLYIDYLITIGITVLVGLTGLIITQTISKLIKRKGKEREVYQKDFYEVLNRNFNNFKMLKLQSGNEQLNDFSSATSSYAKANTISGSFQQFPRLILEGLGFSIIVLIVLFLVLKSGHEIGSFFAVLSVFVLGLFRLLPSVTRMLLSYNQILFYHRSLEIVYEDLHVKKEIIGKEPIRFDNQIILENISFEYEDGKPIFENLRLKIKKGEKIAFVGESGSGKSTLVDLICGLYEPTSGEIMIDGNPLNSLKKESWRNKIGYIPQSVYLFDGTVAENIAFGLNIDNEMVVDALKKANIWEFLSSKEGIDTNVGEGGVMLSGGQKQRIAIARALYRNPEILVLDEATSALDDETEAKIMEEIYKICFDKTLIIIAHRLSTIRSCDSVYKLENGEVKSV